MTATPPHLNGEEADSISSDPALDERQQSSRVPHQDGVDLVLAVTALQHHRHDVAEDVAVAVATEAGEPRAIADVVADHDSVEVTAVDQRPDQAQSCRIVGH